MPPRGGEAALRAQGAGCPAAGVPAERGPAVGRPAQRGAGEGEGGGPAAAAPELETQPAEQPARHDPTGRIPGSRRNAQTVK